MTGERVQEDLGGWEDSWPLNLFEELRNCREVARSLPPVRWLRVCDGMQCVRPTPRQKRCPTIRIATTWSVCAYGEF